MGIGGYSPGTLSPRHEAALDEAIQVLTDEFFEDLVALGNGAAFAETEMAGYLPPKYLPRYSFLFAKQFLTCLLTVAWKLPSRQDHALSCIAEELALRALLQAAQMILEASGETATYDGLREVAFEDEDCELLFRPDLDGIEDSELGRSLGVGNLAFGDWFVPFHGRGHVHPYVEGGAGEQGA